MGSGKLFVQLSLEPKWSSTSGASLLYWGAAWREAGGVVCPQQSCPEVPLSAGRIPKASPGQHHAGHGCGQLWGGKGMSSVLPWNAKGTTELHVSEAVLY